jgi:hypothetical protein
MRCSLSEFLDKLHTVRSRMARKTRQRQTMFKQRREQVAEADFCLLPFGNLPATYFAAAVSFE